MIEQYVSGTISASDKAMLEAEIAANPSLQGDVDFHRDMVKGLRDFRKAELKARLDALPVEVGLFETFTQSTLLKVAASATITAVVVGGIYYFSGNSVERVGTIEKLVPLSIEAGPVDSRKLELQDLARVDAPNEPASAVAEHLSEVPEVEEEEAVPVFKKPAVKEFENEEEFESAPVEGEALAAVAKPAEINMPVDIEVKSRIGFDNKLQYQFYEEKLYLYGDFGNIPYEILEINNRDGKKLYLYHEGTFYRLFYPTQKITELEKVENEARIKELKIFRESKAQH